MMCDCNCGNFAEFIDDNGENWCESCMNHALNGDFKNTLTGDTLKMFPEEFKEIG